MKTITIIPILFLLGACGLDRTIVTGSGPDVHRTIKVDGFSGIRISIDAQVQYVKDTAFSVELIGQSNILDALTVGRSGDNLSVGTNWKTHIRRHSTIRVIVHAPEFKEAHLSGSGDIEVSSGFAIPDLKCSISGSGNMRLHCAPTNTLNATISGSGNITIDASGFCNSADKRISGSGDITAESLEVGSLQAHISGSGNIRGWAKNSLDVHISGSGDVHYKGQPAVEVHISGSGKLVRI